MREGNSFTLCVSPHLDWGGGEYYFQVGGGVLPSRGVLPSQVRGYYLLVGGGVLPPQVERGTTYPRGYYLPRKG